jgi:hypothetical protein
MKYPCPSEERLKRNKDRERRGTPSLHLAPPIPPWVSSAAVMGRDTRSFFLELFCYAFRKHGIFIFTVLGITSIVRLQIHNLFEKWAKTVYNIR